MQKTQQIMGMPVVLTIVGATDDVFEVVFDYFRAVDARFSTYKVDSEMSRINRGELSLADASKDMCEVFSLAKQTSDESFGFFSIRTPEGILDPSGIVKGWAINKAAQLIESHGYTNYLVDIAGDIQSLGVDDSGAPWTIGIRSPFVFTDVVKVLVPRGRGVATSGTYIRGQHIYNPHAPKAVLDEVVSLTVVGPNVYEADRFATAAFAMGHEGVFFIEQLPGFEAYQINHAGIATMTTGFPALTQ